MLTGQHARGTRLVSADLTLSQLVEQPLPLVIQRLHLRDLAAKIAQVGQPVAGVERQLRVDLLAQSLGERGACAGGRDSDLKVPPPYHRRKIKITKPWIIHRVAEDILLSGFFVDRS